MTVLVEHTRAELASIINAYWKKRGVYADARVQWLKIQVMTQTGPRIVNSQEIVSELKGHEQP